MQYEKPHFETPSQKIHDFLVAKKEYVDIYEFTDKYPEAEIDSDAKKVENLEKIYEREDTQMQKETKKLADSFEILMTELVELENWLGEDVFLKETSKYDDLINGIDLVAEFIKEGEFSHLGLAIDVTLSSDVDTVMKKLTRIKEEIEHGKLAEVKYFKSEEANIKDKLENIPRVIVGTDRDTLNELADLWLKRHNLRKAKMNPENTDAIQTAIDEQLRSVGEKLRNHRVQSHILKQIEHQLIKFIAYADKTGKDDVAKKLRSNLDIIEDIMKSKNEIEGEEDKFMELLKIGTEELM